MRKILIAFTLFATLLTVLNLYLISRVATLFNL